MVKNISPEGLCFISNIILPINKEILLEFKISINKQKIKLSGKLVWTCEIDSNLYEYGIEFNDDNQSSMLIEKLNHAGTIMGNEMFTDRLISCSPDDYFKLNI